MSTPSDETDGVTDSLNPETDALRDSYEGVGMEDLWELCASMERERNRLSSCLARVKGPLPIRFIAELAQVFPGDDVHITYDDGYLCVFKAKIKQPNKKSI